MERGLPVLAPGGIPVEMDLVPDESTRILAAEHYNVLLEKSF